MVEIDEFLLLTFCFAYSPVRSKLELLMGSNIVRLTDRKYMLKLMSRIRQDHESKQEARIQDRKMCELMRTKKMILNRFIPVQEAPEEIQRYPLFQLYLYCDAIGEQRRKKRVPKKVRMPKSLYRLLYPEKPTEEEGTPEEEDEESLKEALSDGGSEAEEEDLEGTEHVKVRKKRDHIDEADKEYMFTREEYENLHYEADAVKKLKETRTVNEMYKKAHEIVGILFNYTGGDKRRKMCEGQGND